MNGISERTREVIFSSIVDIGTRHDLPSEKPVFQSHAVKLFDVANQGHYYIVNSLRTWEYPIGDPVQILNWFLAWKWGCVLRWPEVIFFSSALCASLTRLRREPSVSIRKKYPLEPRVLKMPQWLTWRNGINCFFPVVYNKSTGHLYSESTLWFSETMTTLQQNDRN